MRILLRWLTNAALADSIVGDLRELRNSRASMSRAGAWLWMSRTWLAVLATVFWSRVAGAVVTGGGSPRPGRKLRDLRYTLRVIRRTPWYAASVIGVLALSLSLATIVFAVVDGGLFKPLPYRNADRLFVVEARHDGLEPPNGGNRLSVAEVAAWSHALPDIRFAGVSTASTRFPSGDIFEDTVQMGLVPPNFFEVIGERPAVGGFSEAHFAADAGTTPVVVSHGFWQSHLGTDPDVVGRRLELDPAGPALEVVGVMPPGFVFPWAGDLPLIAPFVPPPGQAEQLDARTGQRVIARLPASLEPAVAEQRLAQVMRALAVSFPDRSARNAALAGRLTPDQIRRQDPYDHALLVPLAEYTGRRVAPMFLGVFAAAALLVILACVNVSALMAARAIDRRRDLALRRALGATSSDLARLVLLEASVLAVAGATIGLLAAKPLLALVMRVLPDAYVLFKTPAIDWRVAAFAAGAVVATALAVSVWPVRSSLRGARPETLGGGISVTPSAWTLSRTIVIAAQVALGLVLTVAGALFAGSLAAVWRVDPGFDVKGVAAVDLHFVPDAEGDRAAATAARRALSAEVLARARQLPGVEAAAYSGGQFYTRSARIGGVRAPETAARPLVAGSLGVTPGFREVLRPTLVEGRWFTDEEIETQAPVLVVDEVVAEVWWPDTRAIGQSVRTLAGPLTVIGVAAATRAFTLDQPEGWAAYYRPAGIDTSVAQATLLVRSADADRTARDVIAVVRSVGGIRVGRVGTLTAFIAEAIASRRLQGWLFGGFAAAGLAILLAGVLGQATMAAARRRREVGIRLALGATRQRIVRLFVQDQSRGVFVGLLAGSLASVWTARALDTYLFRIDAFDPSLWTIAVFAVAVVSASGAVAPSLRASRIDPAATLKAE